MSVVATTASAYGSGPLAGVSVTCKDGGVGGVFTPSATQTTNATGTVKYSYQLPAQARAVAITCSSAGYTSALFSETSTVGAPVRMSTVSGNNQTAAPNAPLLAPFVVKVVNATGFAVPGVTVSFTDNSAGGTFVATSVVTDSNGNATAQYTTGPNAGKVTITASTAGVSPVNLKVTVQ